MKIAYLGPEATFTHEAVRTFFPDGDPRPYKTIPDSLDALQREEVEVSVVPLENALEGSVNITLDYLIHEVQFPIVSELILPIRQHLMVHPNYADEWETIEKIYSHTQALAQCHRFLHQQFSNIPREEATSTSAAAKKVKEEKERKIGAIANELAAKHHGLQIVKRDIHDSKNNHTRFAIVANHPVQTASRQVKLNSYKTTITVTLPMDEAGTLHQVLSAFAWRKLNLSKIESRPMKTGLGHYFFIIDIEEKWDDVLIPGAIQELEAIGCGVKILGSYPSYSTISLQSAK
ncbi:prephenate dehydratase [Bacillus litorisediminis]|uniref:prephenate dehydratase n=1 Tax=Bacillus litorisediminis TaxID=2922713 RepID=UPI001FAE05CC|nr:prephenate dehydratase [Bacillus litorisediminis]